MADKEQKETKAPKAEHPTKEEAKAQKAEAKAEAKKHAKPVKAKVAAKDRHCKVSGCKRTYRAKGYCRAHYRKWRHGEFGKARYTSCHANECFKPMALNRFGFCEEHYQSKMVKKTATEAPVEEAAAEAPAAEGAA